MKSKYCTNAAALIPQFNSLGGTPMLFWRAIKEAKEAGAEELDLRRSDLDNQGLITFKECWSATSSTLTTWRAPAVTVYSSFEDIKVRLAKEVCVHSSLTAC